MKFMLVGKLRHGEDTEKRGGKPAGGRKGKATGDDFCLGLGLVTL